MNRTGLLLALAGLILALVLLAQQDPAEIAALLAAAGFGLVLAALAHIPSMAINGHAWGHLFIAADTRDGEQAVHRFADPGDGSERGEAAGKRHSHGEDPAVKR